MSARRAHQPTGLRWRSGILVAALLLGASGCSWQLEHDAATLPSPDSVTAQRNTAAQYEQDVLDALGTDNTSLAVIEALAAPAHLDALGGVYMGAPSPAPSQFAGTLEQAVEAARDGALSTAQDTPDQNLAFLQSSIGLSHALYLWWSDNSHLALAIEPTPSPSPTVTDDADAEPVATPAPAPEPVAGEQRAITSAVDFGTAFTPESATLSPVTFGDLATAHDKARFLYEVIAARSAGTERSNALARRDIHAARAAEFAVLAGSEDRRQNLYDVAPEQVASAAVRAATARDCEFALGATYAGMLDGVAVEDRGWILNAAFDAYTAGALQPGFTVSQFPALPGIDAGA